MHPAEGGVGQLDLADLRSRRGVVNPYARPADREACPVLGHVAPGEPLVARDRRLDPRAGGRVEGPHLELAAADDEEAPCPPPAPVDAADQALGRLELTYVERSCGRVVVGERD